MKRTTRMIYVEEKSIETSEEMKNSSTTNAQQNVTSSSEVTEEVVTRTTGENVPDIIMQTQESQATEADVSSQELLKYSAHFYNTTKCTKYSFCLSRI